METKTNKELLNYSVAELREALQQKERDALKLQMEYRRKVWNFVQDHEEVFTEFFKMVGIQTPVDDLYWGYRFDFLICPDDEFVEKVAQEKLTRS